MPNTTNFNWSTPADTDLVKDGAAAIRTLGNSIDTSFVDLKGGTTGQLLSKASNTDLDFTWSAAPTSGGITTIASGTLSGSSVSLTSIPSTYVDLVLRLSAIDLNTDDKSIKITVNSATGATDYVRALAVSGTMTSASGNPDLTVTGGMDDAVLTNFVEIIMPSYADTSTYQMFNIHSFYADPATTTSLGYFNGAMGVYRANTAISSIQIFAADSTTFNGGSYVLYGVK